MPVVASGQLFVYPERVATASAQNSAQEAKTGRFYRPELDVLRFIAFFCVFNFHFWIWSPRHIPGDVLVGFTGAYGMALFFFLSSYLITELLLREKEKNSKIDRNAFYSRRILRIWPLYFAFLAFATVTGWLHPASALGGKNLLAMLLLVGNWYMTVHGPSPSAAQPLWSISLEEQFYLAWPFVLSRGGKRTVVAVSILLILAGWIALSLHAGVPSETDASIWANSFVQFQFFGMGGIAAICLHGRSPSFRPSVRILLFAGFPVSWLLASFLFRRYASFETGPVLIVGYALMGTGCLALFLGILGLPRSAFPQALTFLGRISYGLYVFHWLNIHLVAAALRRLPHIRASFRLAAAEWWLAMLLTIAMASVSYRWLETPFLRMKERLAIIKSRAV